MVTQNKNSKQGSASWMQRYRPIFFLIYESGRVQVFQSFNVRRTAALVCIRVVEVGSALG